MIHAHSVEIDPSIKPTDPDQAQMSICLFGKMPLKLAAWLVWNVDGKAAWLQVRTDLEDTMRRQLTSLAEMKGFWP